MSRVFRQSSSTSAQTGEMRMVSKKTDVILIMVVTVVKVVIVVTEVTGVTVVTNATVVTV